MRSSDAIQSPAIGAGHEVSHAAEHDRIGTDAIIINNDPVMTTREGKDGVMEVLIGTSVEEARATETESAIATELGEPVRTKYSDYSGTVKTCGPTSNNPC